MSSQMDLDDGKRKSKISYSREFLLSLSGLDVCKNLPTGFDQSILSEFEDAYQRTATTLSSLGYRRNEYGSSPPTRGDLSNYNRTSHARWDSRSSGRSDKDTDSQSDRDSTSESGKRYMNPSRRGWQAPEHDGLLGSGSFPRPSGYTPGASAPKFRPNDSYQLNKTSEPYHPPRPYKAVPHQRRETNDSFNDETFGSLECMDEDKAEEERKRRASFELMRKEQHKEFQERQKMNPERGKVGFDISTLLEDPGVDKRTSHKHDECGDRDLSEGLNGDPTNSSLSSQAPAPRPLVPPGFAGAMQKLIGTEVKMVSDVTDSPAGENTTSNGPFDDKEAKHVDKKMDLILKQHESSDSPKTHSGNSDTKASSVMDISFEPLSKKDLSGDGHLSAVLDSLLAGDTTGVASQNIIAAQSRDSTSVLDKLFRGTLTLDDSSAPPILEQDARGEDSHSPRTVQSSRFAQWFLDEDIKPPVPCGSAPPNELLSLIVGGEKCSPAVDMQAPEQIWQNSHFLGPVHAEGHIVSDAAAAVADESNELFTKGKAEAAPAVLTCEDLENTILSEISDSGSKQQDPRHRWGMGDPEGNEPSASIDNLASQHLLSLLQKGADHTDGLSNMNVKAKFSDDFGGFESAAVACDPDKTKDPTDETLSNLGKTLTLETLFGTAFMRELQSVGAPVSAQRGSGSTGSAKVEAEEAQGLPFAHVASDVFSSENSSEAGAVILNTRREPNSGKLGKQSLVVDDLQANMDVSSLQGDTRLPEEDSLLAVNDPFNFRRFVPGSSPATKPEILSTQTAPMDTAEKLATLNGNPKEKFVGGQGPLPFHVPVNNLEADPFQNIHLPQSSQLRPQQFHPMGSNFPLLDSYPGRNDSPLKLMAQDLPGNMMPPPIQHPGIGFSGFEPPTGHHHQLLQQPMHMTGGFPPTHQNQGYLRPPPPMQHPHLNHQMPAFNHDQQMLMHGVPFGTHRQPNTGGLDVPHQGGVGGGNSHPEALQRLIEMEFRNSSMKQMHPAAAGGATAGGNGMHVSQGMYGADYDMGLGFRYR